MKLIQYDEFGKEIARFNTIRDASITTGIDQHHIRTFIRLGYRLPNGTCLKKLNVPDQTDIAIKEHIAYGTTRAKLERKYQVNTAKLRKAIEQHQNDIKLEQAYLYWFKHQTSIEEVARLHEVSLFRLNKYIELKLSKHGEK